MNRCTIAFGGLLAFALGASLAGSLRAGDQEPTPPERKQPAEDQEMKLGAFSISLAVKDLKRSREFYQKLGFEEIGGDATQHWLILRNGDAVVGLFQGMFERNLLTFNPGWTSREGEEHPTEFTDVREIQRVLLERGLELTAKADEKTTGPAHLTLIDPDGNPILLDQHR